MKIRLTGMDLNSLKQQGDSIVGYIEAILADEFTTNVIKYEDMGNDEHQFHKMMIESIVSNIDEGVEAIAFFEVFHNKALPAKALVKGIKGSYQSLGTSVIGVYKDAEGRYNVTGLGYVNIIDDLRGLLDIEMKQIKRRDTFFINIYVDEIKESLRTTTKLAPHYFKMLHTGKGDYRIEAGRAYGLVH